MLNQPLVKRLLYRLVRLMPRWLYNVLLWLSQCHFLAGTSAFVFDPQGQVLLLHHVFHPEFPWGPPGGWLKSGESPADAIRREVREETGLAITVHRPLYVQEKERHLEIIYFATTDGGPITLSDEILEAAWFDPDAVPHRIRLYHEQVLPWAVTAWTNLNAVRIA